MTAFKLALPRGNRGRLYEIIDPTEIAPENFRASPISLLTFTVYFNICDHTCLTARVSFFFCVFAKCLCVFYLLHMKFIQDSFHQIF